MKTKSMMIIICAMLVSACEILDKTSTSSNKNSINTSISSSELISNLSSNSTEEDFISYEKREIKSILYYTVTSWIPYEDDKYYDFENLTYSIRKTIQNIDIYKDMLGNIEEYEKGYQVISTFSIVKSQEFIANIKSHGIFSLNGDYIAENFCDGESWHLLITFYDDSIYYVYGYMKNPEQAIKINADSQAFIGDNLFDIYNFD